MRKGFWHLVDAVMASIILISFMAIIASPAIFVPQPENMNDVAYNLLRGLDDMGYLSTYAMANDYNGLNSKISFYSHNHSIEICDDDGTCHGSRPSESNVWVATYLTAGESVYSPKTVRLFVWE